MTEAAEPSGDLAGTRPGGAGPRLPWVGLGLGVLGLLLAIFPWAGLAVALVALVVSVVAWRRCAGARTPDGEAPGLGMSQAATGLALSVLAITVVWTFVATVVPRPVPRAPVDCTSPTLSPADAFTCRQGNPQEATP